MRNELPMRPAVSIIVPTFNRLQFIAAAIESVFAQTFLDWELLIADDGSDADTATYLQSLHDPPRVQVLWLAHTGKPSVVRNAALRAARGEYIAFLDSDDLWLPNKLAAQMASLRYNTTRRWSYTRFTLVDGTGTPRLPGPVVDAPIPAGWIVEKLLNEETVIALPSVIASRALLDEVGAFDEELTMCEDDELWFRLAAHAEIDAVDEPLTVVRRHAHHSGSDILAWQDRRRVFEKLQRASRDVCLSGVLRQRRAEMAAGLARSQAACGQRLSALFTLASSATYSWRYPRGWLRALGATARSFAPAAMRTLVRQYRYPHRVQSP